MSPEEEKRRGVFLYAERWPPDSTTTFQVVPPEETGFVTREEFERYRNTAGWAFIILFLLLFLLFPSMTCRADSTFVPKTRQWGFTVPPGSTIDSIQCVLDSTGPGLCVTFPPILIAVKIDGKWVRLRWLIDSLPPMHPDTIPRARGLDSTFVLGDDTCWSIPSKHPRLTLDTCMKIPNHWEYFNWLNGKRVNMRRVK